MTRGGVVAQKKTRRRRGRPKAEDCSDDDEEYVVGEDGEEESTEESFVSSDSGGGDSSEVELDSEDEEIVAARPRSKPKLKARKAVASGGMRRRGGRPPARRKPRVGVGSRTRRARVSDDDEEDEDFDPDDVDEEEVSLISSRRSVLNPCPKRKRSKASSKPKNNAKKVKKNTGEPPESRRVRVREEEDDDFVEKDQSIDLENQKNRGNRRRKRLVAEGSDSSDFDYEVSSEEEEEEEKEKPKGQPRRKNRSRISDSDSEFSDFVVSEDEEKVRGRGRPRKKKKNERKKRSRLVDSELEFSDFVISDEELRDLGIGGESNGQQKQQRQQQQQQQQQPKRIVAEKKEEEKGKEKAEVDSGKQVCGICLSEEKKTTVQGLLECCAHYFCFACIMEWSKVESRCPVCKRRFASISKSGGPLNPGLGNRRAVIRVPKRDQVYQPSEEEMRGFLDPYENVVCVECQQGGDDYLMLLCDICDTPAHTYCVGLGRDVPEGNWYCEGCRPMEDGFSYAQFVNGMDQGASSADPLSGHSSFSGIDNCRNTHSSTIQQPITPQGQSPFLGIDLNVSPRYPWREEHDSASQSPRTGASTLSGRRAIQQRIRILFNRSRQNFARDAGYEPVISSGLQRRGPLPQSDGLIHPNPLQNLSDTVQTRQNSGPIIQQSTLNEGSSFRLADGAKEQVQSMVRSHMKGLSRNIALERATYKDIARRSTYTILAACGIGHHREIVTSPVQLPNTCTHDSDDGPGNLMKNCCSACFSLFVQGVVEKLMKDS
ncbi:putative chromatin regulator PHD family [Dioscorea sansibarensis]